MGAVDHKKSQFLEYSMQTVTISFDPFNKLSDEACQEAEEKTVTSQVGTPTC